MHSEKDVILAVARSSLMQGKALELKKKRIKLI